MCTKRNLNIQVDILIQNTERYRISCPVFITDDFLRIKVINPLIFCRVSSERKSLHEGLKAVYEIFSQTAVKNTGFRRTVKYKLTRFRTNLYNGALLHNNHTLTVIYRNKRSIGNDIIRSFCIGAFCPYSFFSLYNEGIII